MVRVFASILIVAALSGCRIYDLRLWERPCSPEDACEIEVRRGLPYVDAPSKDSRAQSLDLYLPKGRTDFPVVVLVHGGGWVIGDNRCCGLYSTVGEFLASQGIGVVMPNYRLSPAVKHPEHVRDVARAVAWTRQHAAEFGGRPDQLFLAGHSAGGHLVSLLATDETWLKAEGLSTADVKGVIAISGVYEILSGRLPSQLGGTGPYSFRLEELLPIRGELSPATSTEPSEGLPVHVDPFVKAFGKDPEVRRQAAPLTHVRSGLPPWLILAADKDLPGLQAMGDKFSTALKQAGNNVHYEVIPARNHNTILFRAMTPEDPVAMQIVGFVNEHASSAPSNASSRE